MMNDIEYKPNMDVVRSCRAFIRSLCETYGHTQGMAVWDQVRTTLGDRAAGDIMFGMLLQTDEIVVRSLGANFIDAIKELRALTGWGLKESKDFCDLVRAGTPQRVNISHCNTEAVDRFTQRIRELGGSVD